MRSLRCGDKKLLDIATSISSNEEGLVSGKLVYEYVTAAILAAIPVGEVCMFWGDVVPAGFLRCDGALYSKTTYARLYASRGGMWPQNSTQFAVPDFIARYPRGRGWEAEGTYFDDAIRNLTGGLSIHAGERGSGIYNPSGAISGEVLNKYITNADTPRSTGSTSLANVTFDAARQVPTANENRPRTVVVHFCIKYQ